MKNYRRQYPQFSLCGLNCGLCPIHHMENGCPGCGGGEGHQSCAKVRCSLQHGGVEYCYLCGEYPCEKYDGAAVYDIIIVCRNQMKDLEKAKEIGLPAYLSEQQEKQQLLVKLLKDYNDGRRKTFFCTAANLLELEDLKSAWEKITEGTQPGDSKKEKAAFAAKCLQELADTRNVDLKFHKKPKTN